MTTTKQIAYAVLAALIVLSCSWLTGFDFDHRGFEAFATAFFTLVAVGGVIGATNEMMRKP